MILTLKKLTDYQLDNETYSEMKFHIKRLLRSAGKSATLVKTENLPFEVNIDIYTICFLGDDISIRNNVTMKICDTSCPRCINEVIYGGI